MENQLAYIADTHREDSTYPNRLSAMIFRFVYGLSQKGDAHAKRIVDCGLGMAYQNGYGSEDQLKAALANDQLPEDEILRHLDEFASYLEHDEFLQVAHRAAVSKKRSLNK